MIEKEAMTREEYKRQREREAAEAKAKEKTKSASKPAVKAVIPVWLRFVIIVALIIICVTVGAIVGYSGIGGGKAADVFKESTWMHIYDLVEKK